MMVTMIPMMITMHRQILRQIEETVDDGEGHDADDDDDKKLEAYDNYK